MTRPTPAGPGAAAAGGFHRPAATLARDGWACELTPADAGWAYSGLRVLELAAGRSRTFGTGDAEMLVLPLAGGCDVDCDGERAALAGRPDVWSGPTDFAYLPPGSTVTVSSAAGGRFALPAARAGRRYPFRTRPAAAVPVELRGAGSCSRQVHNFCTPEVFEADRLIACEVLTPGGNWSSYPPHKHDEDRPGESVLEEIYWFQTAGPAYQQVYGSTAVLAEVRTGDAVLVPRGWHGPSMAAPGYDLYYLNVMAGPGAERAWRICDDPAHAWVRETWAGQPVDPRLPFGPGERPRPAAGTGGTA
ncbi:MAG: 5-deoxy-glucuronate isomerase [uncultured Corynebacteriales bacterium]|uniref:5-deoxy-glucuronate isomerase n=1 Tax=uncultured Mycobacteriales bacterium TaxID=581187 RepID=A0A6J4K1J2_9ACTN|nr:MAG: 5-deoxy-glucuronate isomerase [uncultured Corynebacteriales bacterium]